MGLNQAGNCSISAAELNSGRGYAFLVRTNGVASAGFGSVEGQICTFDQFAGRPGITGERGAAEADRHPSRFFTRAGLTGAFFKKGECCLLDASTNAFSD